MKYRYAWMLAGVLAANSVWADDFQDRVALAKQTIETPAGAAYDQLLMPYIQTSVKQCLVLKANTNPVEQFTLVGNVSNNGQLVDAQVQPKTPFADCFVGQFTQASLPSPELSQIKQMPHPIVVNVLLKLGN